MIRRFPNGETHPDESRDTRPVKGIGSEPAEVKHLSKRRKRKKRYGASRSNIPLVVASEKGIAQTSLFIMRGCKSTASRPLSPWNMYLLNLRNKS
ncbi:MAG: hypothetical protein A3I85_03045 [Candidatus Nealsonbacteria bacterium RIFCSPLOWO2_02_FULL_38_63]|nr:MAG: hypothetical protein A3I85_03045 [Candidatus Nealsonbacteria bacterium RIFCSPLOWO2_02_FULL_38_63]